MIRHYRVTLALTLALAVMATAFVTTESALPATSGCRAVQPGLPAPGGRSIRVLHALANDEPVDLAREQSIREDVESVSAWWQANDASREPRFETAWEGCAFEVSVHELRLPDPASVLWGFDGRGDRLSAAAITSGDGNPFIKYLVYYDGPVEGKTCGWGSGQPDGASVAIVYAAACPGVATPTIAAHELIHTLLGTSGLHLRHGCAGSEAHVCDTSTDILYPYASHGPLSALGLDVGHDDYYADGEARTDLRDSGWLTHVDDQVALTITAGGGGSVRTNLPAASCGSRCTTFWDRGTWVTLGAVARPGTRFAGWAGGCRGMGACEIELRGAVGVTARFAPSKDGQSATKGRS